MKNTIEIAKKLSQFGWSVYRLSQATGETEFNIKYALQNPEKTDIRRKISSVTGLTCEELYGEEI